jgi:hypothetical protein
MLPPMVERELRVALLRRKARHQWMVAAWSAGGICLCFLLVLGLGPPRRVGHTLFIWLFALGCAGIISRGFGLTADLFSEERRNGTLGLLVLAGLRPMEIFTNKLLGAGLLAGYALLGALPFFAVPFLTGGVSATQFLCALAFLANGLLFCVAIGLLASVIHREGGQAQSTALIVTALLSLATPLLRWFSSAASTAHALPLEWLALSPVYPPYLVFNNFVGGSSHLFWVGSGFTLVYSLTALLSAGLVLHYTWRDGPETLAPQSWREHWQAQGRGPRSWRNRLRARWLSRNPFCWLAARDRRPAFLTQGLVATAALVWLLGWAAVGVNWIRPANAFTCSIVIHLCFNWILAYAAGRRLAEERLTGGFEVLLTIPLEPKTIVDGQCRALLVQFRHAWITVFAFDLILCASSFVTGGWNTPAAVIYLLVWAVLIPYWFANHLETGSRAMWISTWTGRPAYAALRSIQRSLWIPFWIWVLSRGTRGLPSMQGVEIFTAILVATLYIAVLLRFAHRHWLREKLTRELRLIAVAPIPARGDKRFKKWDPALIFPPGRWGEWVLEPGQTKPHRHRRHHRHRPTSRRTPGPQV